MKSKQLGLGMFNLLLILAIIVAIVVLALPRFMASHQGAEKTAQDGLSSLYKATDKVVGEVQDKVANKEGEKAPEAPAVQEQPKSEPAMPAPEAAAEPAPAAPAMEPAPATPAPANPAPATEPAPAAPVQK